MNGPNKTKGKYRKFHVYCQEKRSRHSSVGIATRYGLDSPDGSNPGGRGGFPHLSRTSLKPTQPPMQWVPGLSRG